MPNFFSKNKFLIVAFFIILFSFTTFTFFQKSEKEQNINNEINTTKKYDFSLDSTSSTCSLDKKCDAKKIDTNTENQIESKIISNDSKNTYSNSTTTQSVTSTKKVINIDNEIKKESNLISVKLIVENNAYSIQIPEGKNVYYLMQELMKHDNFTFTAKNFSGMGYFIEEINGQKNNPKNNTYWIYYINGKLAEVGVSQKILQQGDEITWKYEKSNL